MKCKNKFSPYVLQILRFSMSNYLNAYKQFLFILTVVLWNVFSSEILCCVFKFDCLSDESIKHLFNLYLNEWKLNIYIFGK